MSNSLWPHEPQHSRPPCPLPTPRVYSNSCPLSHWCHQTISSSVIRLSSRLQSFPVSVLGKNTHYVDGWGPVLGMQWRMEEVTPWLSQRLLVVHAFFTAAVSNYFSTSFLEHDFSTDRGRRGWFGEDSRVLHLMYSYENPCGSDGRESTCSAGGPGSIPGSGTSPGKGNGS